MLLPIAFLFSTLITVALFLFPKKEKESNAKSQDMSVIIPAYNSEKTIRKCIQSVLNTKYKNLEIIVVNDGSTDSTAKIVKSFRKHGVKLINQKNMGKDPALNNGFKYSRYPIILALDSDTFITQNFFSQIVKHFDENVGAVVPKILVENKHTIITTFQEISYFITSMLGEIQNKFNKVFMVRGAAMAIHRNAWVSVHGFKNKISDDYDFALRLIENGWKVKYVSSSCVKTIAPEKLKKMLSQQIRWAKGTVEWYFSNWKFLIKNIHYLILFQLPIFFGLATLINFLFYSGGGRIPIIFWIIYNLIKNPIIVISFLERILYSSAFNYLIGGFIMSVLFSLLIRYKYKKMHIYDIVTYFFIYIPLIGITALVSYILSIKDLIIDGRVNRGNF
jgi:cellulose synthase/poly-beta-1,6-N-acetylglucosamine synthase-like glycosyltransferase